MKAAMKMEKPDDMQATITITMPVKEWKMLRDKLKDGQGRIGFIPGQFAELIGMAIGDAEKVFTSSLVVDTSGADMNMRRES